MTQFNRTASVSIGKEGDIGIHISGLRIAFEVTKTTDKAANKATITIYNLSAATRNKIQNTDEKIFLKAGYVDSGGEEVIFAGDIININHKKAYPGFLTIIKAKDGHKALKDTRIALSFRPGATAETILNKVVRTFDLSNELKHITIPNKVYVHGFSFIGPAKIALDKLTAFLGFEWSVQNDMLKIIQKETTDTSRAIVLSAATGLLGSPERLSTVLRKNKGNDKKDKPGWKFVSLLKPQIIPNGRVSVSSSEITNDTVFKVVSVQHSGDVRGNKFVSVIEVIE